MKIFVVAANIFTVLMYLVFAFTFPIPNDKSEKSDGGKLFELYNTLMVFEGICFLLTLC